MNTHKTVCIPKLILSSTLVADGIFTSASPLLKTGIPSLILCVLISVVGNASPFAIRSTSYCVPCEGQAALLSCLPLGALITPLVKQSAEEVSFSLLSLLHIQLKMEMKLQYCCYNQLIWHLDIRCIKCVCLLPLEATPTVQRDRVCCGLWGVWSFHVSSDGLAGLWSKVLLPLLWQTQ